MSPLQTGTAQVDQPFLCSMGISDASETPEAAVGLHEQILLNCKALKLHVGKKIHCYSLAQCKHFGVS